MSPPSTKIVQYGKRSILKKKASPECVYEPPLKRQKLLNDRQFGENHSLSRDTTSSIPKGVGAPETVHAAKVSTSETLTIKSSHTTPRKNAGRGCSATTPDDVEPPTLLDVDVEEDVDGDHPPLTFSNAPQCSQSPYAARGGSHTPTCKPKDLSGIFAHIPQPSSPSCNREITTPAKNSTKRMLARSRTEPMLLSPATPSPKSTLKASLSLPVIGTASPPHKPQPPPLEVLSKSPQSPHSPSRGVSNPCLRTYSQSRSFLVPLPASMAVKQSSSSGLLIIQDSLSEHDVEEVRESYTDLRARWGVDSSEDTPSNASGQTNDLLSITELRSTGESRRFHDEVGYLFEGLEEPGLAASVRRSSAAEIVTKMCDPEFMRMAKAADFISHAWDSMRAAGAGDGNKVLDLYLVSFIALVARDKRDVDDLSRRNGFLDTILRMLQYSQRTDGFCIKSDVDARKAGFSKSEWISISNLRDTMVTKSGLLTSYSVPSARFFLSYALSRTTFTVYPQRLLSPLFETLIRELQLLCPKNEVTIPSITTNLDHINHCLIILDICLLSSAEAKQGRNHLDAVQNSLCDCLINLCAMLRTISLDNEHGDIACQCMENALRVLVNLSHISAKWCERLVEDQVILHILVCEILSVSSLIVKKEAEEADDKTLSFDRQCLALALLSNLLYVIGDAKDRFRDISLSLSCTGRQHCSMSCHCAQQVSAIACLIALFVKMSIKSESSDTPEFDFFQWHLAALLCLIIIGNHDNEVIVRQELTKANGSGSLKSSVRFLRKFYEEAERPVTASRTLLEEDDMQRQIESACALLCR